MTNTDNLTDSIPHSEILGPTSVRLRKNEMELGDHYARTFYVSSWPPQFKAGMFDKLTSAPGSAVEVAIHQTPVPREQSIKRYADAISDGKALLMNQQDRGSPQAARTQKQIKQDERTKEQLENGKQRIHHVAVYITLRKPTVDELDSLENTVKTELLPGQVTLEPVKRAHGRGATSTSPIAKDAMGKTTRMKTAALATLFPFSSDTILEENGVLWGYHAVSGAPVMVDRFGRDENYNMVISGDSGSGKSFGGKLIMLRERIKDPNVAFLVVDPLSDFTRFVTQLKGDDVTIGGTKGLNPLSIEPTPQYVFDRKPDLDPYGKKLEGVDAFFKDFFAGRGVTFDHDVTVRQMATSAAYNNCGITKDPETHHNPDPTIRSVPDRDENQTLRGVLKDLDNNPDKYVPDASESELEKYSDAASDVRMELHPFCEGQPYSHLGGTSDVSIDDDSTVVGMDMQQAEQRGDMGLMIMEMLDSAYELAKLSPKHVVLCIDEAHQMLDHQNALDWLARVVRHARHHDLSVMLLTQNIEDFLTSEKRRSILGNCSMQLHWHENKLNPEHAEALKLSPREADFIRDAKPGDWDRGFSHALAVVDGDRKFPIKVEALKSEAALIDEDLANRFGGA